MTTTMLTKEQVTSLKSVTDNLLAVCQKAKNQNIELDLKPAECQWFGILIELFPTIRSLSTDHENAIFHVDNRIFFLNEVLRFLNMTHDT